MAIRNALLGGTNWSLGEASVKSADLNDTFNAACQFRVGLYLPTNAGALTGTAYTVSRELVLTEYNCFSVEVFEQPYVYGNVNGSNITGYFKMNIILNDATEVELVPEITSGQVNYQNYNVARIYKTYNAPEGKLISKIQWYHKLDKTSGGVLYLGIGDDNNFQGVDPNFPTNDYLVKPYVKYYYTK